jgi:pyruvate dehydrogenase E1 component alpha subunit
MPRKATKMSNRIDNETLLRLYRDMLRIRLVEERLAELYPQQEMRCPVHLCIGQEAVPVGVCARLRPEDYAMSGHRSHGHYLAKGGNLPAMLAEIYGKVTGCSRGKGGSMHLVDLAAGFLGATPIVASTIPMAVGAALGAAMKGEDRVAVAFFGDAATEEGVFYESVNFAVLKRLPVLFVCENNLYSVYSPLAVRQPNGRDLCKIAEGEGATAARGDGNNVSEVYRLTGEAVARARRGDGPTVLEFDTYRWREHCGPYYDNDIGYRSETEFLARQQECPVARTAKALLETQAISTRDLDALRAEVEQEITGAVDFAKASPFPDPTEMRRHIYAV